MGSSTTIRTYSYSMGPQGFIPIRHWKIKHVPIPSRKYLWKKFSPKRTKEYWVLISWYTNLTYNGGEYDSGEYERKFDTEAEAIEAMVLEKLEC